jgi:hypothetical protein
MTDKIEQITTERGKNYGHPIKHFACTQSMYMDWVFARSQSEIKLPPQKEAGLRHGVYMILDKLARMSENPLHSDNIDDIQGYAKCIQMVLDYDAQD